jgi:hypothetical protein
LLTEKRVEELLVDINTGNVYDSMQYVQHRKTLLPKEKEMPPLI